ncbi:hypothetical protein EV360DRAFT_80218 [Lentinula raphanica]|nr:hypothetical protein EV360DRAFT_80218 [Lentinula raphanica]
MLLPLQLLSIFFLPTLLVTGSPVPHKDSSPVNDAIEHNTLTTSDIAPHSDSPPVSDVTEHRKSRLSHLISQLGGLIIAVTIFPGLRCQPPWTKLRNSTLTQRLLLQPN